MDEEGETKPVENLGGERRQLSPEDIKLINRAQEIRQGMEGKQQTYPFHRYLERLAQDDMTSPTDAMNLGMLMEQYPGLSWGSDIPRMALPIKFVEALRQKQIANVSALAKEQGRDLVQIGKDVAAAADDILAQIPGLSNPHDILENSELRENLREVIGVKMDEEERDKWVQTIIPNLVTGRELQGIALKRLSENLPSESGQT